MHGVLASLPPVVTVVLLWRGVGPLRAAAVALAVTLALVPLFAPMGPTVTVALAATAATGVEVAAIMLAGLTLHRLLEQAGVHGALAAWLTGRVQQPALRLLLVVLGIAPFVEAVAGFGMCNIIAYPLLLHMGLPPRAAALAALLAGVTVPWGALGPGTLVAARLAGISLQELGEASAAISLPVFLVCGMAALGVALGWRQALGRSGQLAVVAVSLWAGIWLANRLVGTPAAGILGSPAAVVAVLALEWIGRPGQPAARRPVTLPQARLPAQAPPGAASPDFPARALVPFGLLVALLLLSRGLAFDAQGPGPTALPAGTEPPAREAPVLGGLLTSPALWLWVTCAFTAFWLRMGWAGASGAMRWAADRAARPVLTTVAFLALGNLMRAGGMASSLAGLAAGLGPAYVALAPWIGGLGGLVTGTNAGANAMLAAAQAGAALQLGYPVVALVALHNVSAALLTMGAGWRLALLASLAGPPVRPEGLLRPVLATGAVALALLSILAPGLGWARSGSAE